MAVHHVAATSETVRLGMFDAAIPPVLTIASGDTVTLECLSGGPEVMRRPAASSSCRRASPRSMRPA